MKMKIASVMIATLITSSVVASIAGAATLDGGIDVYIDQFIGLVTPESNFTEEQQNQTVTFLVNCSTTPDGNVSNMTYVIEDELIINLNIQDTSGRDSFIFPRSLICPVLLVRDPKDVKLMPILGYFKRLIPVRVLMKSEHVANSLFGEKVDNITIPISYSISNETYNEGNGTENMTLHLFTMGFLPGDQNGIDEKLPILEHIKINLEILYDELI